MRGRTAALVLLAIVMTVLMASMASALSCTATWINPSATGATLSDNEKLNITVDCDAETDDGNATNATWEYKLTTDSSWTQINSTANMSRPQVDNDFATRIDTSALYDQLTYQIRVSFYNGTIGAYDEQVAQDTTLLTIYSNNTVPTVTWLTTGMSNNKEFALPTTFKWTANSGATCNLLLYESDNMFDTFKGSFDVATLGSETCSAEIDSKDVSDGIYRFIKVQATDLGAADTTTGTVYEYVQLTSQKSAVNRYLAEEGTLGDEVPSSGVNVGRIALLGLIGYGIYYFVRKRK